jgi:type I restriction enzyme S subunit
MSESYAGGKLCEPGDLVLNRLKAHLGVFALAPKAGVISPDYTVLRPISAMYPQYFEAVYRTPACRVVLRQKAKGIVQGFWRLYTDDFYDIAVPVPPPREQAAIVDGVARDLVGVQKALAQADREIALMQEYRTRLVSDVVTGELDVRAAAASLPDIEPATAPTEVEGDEGTDIEDGEAA